MPVDSRTIYKRLAELLGGKRGDPALSRGEFYDVPGFGERRVQPVSPSGWDTREVWETGSMANGWQPRYKEGEIPPWMKEGVNFMLAGAGKLSDEEMKYLARHWVYGEGVDPGYKAAHDAMPTWARDWLKSQFAPWLQSQAQ